jgi:hypothetical protein
MEMRGTIQFRGVLYNKMLLKYKVLRNFVITDSEREYLINAGIIPPPQLPPAKVKKLPKIESFQSDADKEL